MNEQGLWWDGRCRGEPGLSSLQSHRSDLLCIRWMPGAGLGDVCRKSVEGVAPFFLVLFLVYFSERMGWDGGGEGSSPGQVMWGDEELEFQAGELDFVLFPFE